MSSEVDIYSESHLELLFSLRFAWPPSVSAYKSRHCMRKCCLLVFYGMVVMRVAISLYELYIIFDARE